MASPKQQSALTTAWKIWSKSNKKVTGIRVNQTPTPEAPVLEYCNRNQQPIADALAKHLPKKCFVLEIGSGTGQHGAYITEHYSHFTWQPSELVENLGNIELWRQKVQRRNFLPPLILDVNQPLWPVEQANAVFTANTVHFVDWRTVQNMFDGVRQVLAAGGLFLIYGPFNYSGEYESDGNRSLDEWLKGRNPDSGIKDFEQLQMLARSHGFELRADEKMPANNHILVFRMKPKGKGKWLKHLKHIKPIKPIRFKRKS